MTETRSTPVRCFVLVIWLGFLAWHARDSVAAENVRFAGRLANGERVSDAELAWQDANPRLGGRAILDANNPFRWILAENRAPVPIPAAYVEFVGGDRLPGTVLGIGPQAEFGGGPRHLLIEPAVHVDDPATDRTTAVRVATASLTRIVWDARSPRGLQPGTVFRRDGRETSFRTLRWGDGTILVLTTNGLESIPIAAVAEVHLPSPDAWEVYATELAVLSPRLEDRLLRWEATGGLVVTSSTSRFEAGFRGDFNRQEHWSHRVQPAWCLDPLWLRFDTVRSVVIRDPHEVALSRIPPESVRRESVFGGSWRPRRDRSVQGTSLRSGEQPFGWGWGVQARTELAFALPVYAANFESEFGLDEVVGAGGAVKGSVHISSEPRGHGLGARLFEGPLTVGSSEVRSTGSLDVTAAAREGRRLILVADMAHGQQPAGGDPFDVRDSCDWMDPVLHLDREALLAEVRRRALDVVPVLAEWEPGVEAPVVVESWWDESDRLDPRYVLQTIVSAEFATWSRSIRIATEDRWLAIGVHHRGPNDDAGTDVVVRFDGRAVGEFTVPRWTDEWGPNPVLVPLTKEVRGRDVEVELVVLPRKPGESAVVWRGIEPVVHPPHLLRVFDEELGFADRLDDGDGVAMVTLEDGRRGIASLEVMPPGRGRATLPNLNAMIRERPRDGEYRYLRFSWRKDGGEGIALRLAREGEFDRGDGDGRVRFGRESAAFPSRRDRPGDRRGAAHGYTYTAQRNPPAVPGLNVEHQPPADWRQVTRDLYGDFGEFALTGFWFDAIDGETAYFDEVYLARKGQDLAAIDQPVPVTNVAAEFSVHVRDPWRISAVLNRVAPGFTSRALGDGAALMREFNGRTDVLRTFAPGQDEPAILRRPFVVPEQGSTKLTIDATRQGESEWRLEVGVGPEMLLSEVVGNGQTYDEAGWRRFEVDLTKFAGQPIVIEIRHQRHGGNRQIGLFGAVRIETK